MSRFWFPGVIVALALAAGVYFVWQRPIEVEIVQPETNVQIRIYGLGTVEARILSRVGFEVGAAIVTLNADVGDIITKGQVLARLHGGEQEARVARARAAVAVNDASLARAEAALGKAKAVLTEKDSVNKRQQRLAKQDVTSTQRAEEAQRDLDVARADLAVTEAEISVIKAQAADAAAAVQLEETLLQHHTLFAPYDAVVVSRLLEAGTVVKAGDPVFTVIEQKTVWVQAYIDEERAGQLAIGQPATIKLRSRPDAEFAGTVSRIGLESDRVNEERLVWLSCMTCPQPMYLGEQAEVRILTGEREQALMVPETSITGFDGHLGHVWLLRDGKLKKTQMQFGARDDKGRVELIGSPPNGAYVVANPPKTANEDRAAKVAGNP
jgi:HlyD family secretion protein